MPTLKRALADAGLKVVSVIALHGWITADGAEHERVLDECRRRMAQAVELGSPYIVASPPQEVVDSEPLPSTGSPSCSRSATQLGVIPSMEFLGFVDGIKNVASAWAIASGTGDPRATVVADVFHMIRGGGSVDDLLTLDGRSSRLLPHQRRAGLSQTRSPRKMKTASWSARASPTCRA